tara:strand:+ start:668 stop:1087 length:420 start_codon:yes stop_codon:yes gene_type:complete
MRNEKKTRKPSPLEQGLAEIEKLKAEHEQQQRDKHHEIETVGTPPSWKSIVYETLRILPHATPSGRLDLHDQLLAIGHRADRFVQLRALLLQDLETAIPLLGAVGALMHRDGVAYRAVWIPVGGVICNTLTSIEMEGEE